MRYFFALQAGPGVSLDMAYLLRHRRALLVRNLVMVVIYGLVITRIQQDHSFVALALTVLAALHALMIGVLFGRSAE